MKKIFLLIFLFILFLSNKKLSAQIAVTDGQSAAQLAEALSGQCVTILNPTLNGSCASTARGMFTNGDGDVGIDSGIVLTCGRVVTSGSNYGVNAEYDDFATNSFGGAGDPDLTTISGSNTNDACVLEFDFVPLGSSVNFDYVFASEEYNYPGNWNFNCSYNDVFGFFISGPGYVGLTNIALIPGTEIAVGVSTVNDGVGADPGNQCYTLTNGNGPYTEYYNSNAGSASFVYSGYTDVFTAHASVVPCDTYHLKLAIADAGDFSYDSGVFLKAGSLSSPPELINTTESGIGIDTNVTSTIRGCPPAKITIGRESCINQPLTIHYNITGTAINGVDYTQIPDSVVLAPGDETVDIFIQGLNIENPTGPKTVILEFFSPYTCFAGMEDSVVARDTVVIFDSLHVNIIQPDTAICIGSSVNLNVQGESYYSYQWTPANTVNDPTGTDVTVTPSSTTTYVVQARIDGIVCPPATDHITIDVHPGPDLELGPDLNLCTYDTAYLYAAVIPTNDTYSYSWSPGAHLSDSTSNMAVYFNDYPETETIIVTATTPVGCKGIDTININVNSGDFLKNVIADTGVCPGTVFQYNVTGADSFHWEPADGLSNPNTGNPVVTPLTTQDYILYGMRRGCVDSQLVHLEVHPQAVISLPDSTRLYPGESYQMDPEGNCLYYQWFPPSGLSANNISNPVAMPDVRTRYFVTGTTEYDCIAKDSIDVLVNTESVLDLPNAFTPGNGPNPTFKIIKRGEASLKTFAVYDRWGNKVFETTDINKGWDGTFNNKPQPMGVYIYRVEAITTSGTSFAKDGNVTLLR